MYNTHMYIPDDMKQRHFVIEQPGRGASSALVCLNSKFFLLLSVSLRKVEQAYYNINLFLEGSLMGKKEGI